MIDVCNKFFNLDKINQIHKLIFCILLNTGIVLLLIMFNKADYYDLQYD